MLKQKAPKISLELENGLVLVSKWLMKRVLVSGVDTLLFHRKFFIFAFSDEPQFFPVLDTMEEPNGKQCIFSTRHHTDGMISINCSLIMQWIHFAGQ